MPQFLRISNSGRVLETIDFDPVGRFHPSLRWWPFNTDDEKRDALKFRATAHRWVVETGGIMLPNGVLVETSVESQNRIDTVISNAERAGVEVIDFKAVTGWVTLTVAEIEAVASAIALHVQACFSAERAHHDAIDAATGAGLTDYDIYTGWPTP